MKPCIRCNSVKAVVSLNNGDYACQLCMVRYNGATVKLRNRLQRLISGNRTGESYYSHRLRDWVPSNQELRSDMQRLGDTWDGQGIKVNEIDF